MAVITITKDCIHAIVLVEKRNAIVALRGSGIAVGAFTGVNPFKVEAELARMENYYDTCMESTNEQDPAEPGMTYCRFCRMQDTGDAEFTYEKWSAVIFSGSLTWGK